MSGHSGICIHSIGNVQDIPLHTARPACFAPALSLRSSFGSAQGIAVVFSFAATRSSARYESRHDMAATFSAVATL